MQPIMRVLWVGLAAFAAACRTSDEPRSNGVVEQAPDVDAERGRPATDAAPAAFTIEVPSSLAQLEFVPIPPGRLGDVEVGGFWMSTTEVPWEAYDVLVHRLDLPEDQRDADAETRPSKPYINMDRGFGHNGYPAISMSAHGAEQFCAWLSERTGRSFRLPTDTEWEYACRAGSEAELDEERAATVAWFRANADWKTHPIATKGPNAYGLFDMRGNAAEWCRTGADGHVVCGGSYKDPLERLRADARVGPSPDWNASDPQVPKSVWWLADAGWIGFRLVCAEPVSS